MLEFYLRSSRGLARARSSSVGPYLDGFSVTLRDLGYCWRIGAGCITYAVHLGLWATANDVSLRTLDDEDLTAFLAHLPRCRCPGRRAGRHAAAASRTKVFVHYLRTAGIIAMPVLQVATPKRVGEFCEWMRLQRGLKDTTVRQYRRCATALVERLRDDPAAYEPRALRAAVRELTGSHGISTARAVAKVARAFVRYLAVEGLCRPGLDAAILPIASRRLASLPRYVSSGAVQQIIDACDPDRPGGARDRAIVLLIARLGLRGGDIVQMRLCDIDWTDARVRVVGKGRREARLPLPQEVGDAILAYLRDRHPIVACDRVFLRARAPWRPLAQSACVSAIVKRAIARAGVSAPTRGAHLLRHSAATAMLREGISLPSIGAILRHRSVETTVVYAKVDVELLRSVAQPWIGATPCS